MSSFVYDGLTPPDGKTNARNLTGPAAESVTAEEWNAVMSYLEDIRTALLSGNFSGLTEYAAPVSEAGKLRLRYYGGSLQSSVNGGAYTPFGGTGFLNVKDFGAVGDSVTDDIDAFDAAIAAMSDIIPAAPGNTLLLPPGQYRISRSINLTRGVVLQGSGAGSGDENAGCQIIADAGIEDAIVMHRYNTSHDGGRGDGSCVRDIYLVAAGKTGATTHGIRMWARGSVQNCVIANFSGNGIHIEAQYSGYVGEALPDWAPVTAYALGDMVFNDGDKWYVCKQAGTSAGSGGPTGTAAYPATVTDGTCKWGYVVGTNANGWSIFNCRISGCAKNGVYVHGSDANAGTAIVVDTSTCGEWGIWDDSFLGNTWTGCQGATNTLGAYRCDGASCQSTFNGCYSEQDQPASIISYPSTVWGGLHAAGNDGDCTGIRTATLNGKLRMPLTTDGSNVRAVFGENTASGSIVDIQRGSDGLVQQLTCPSLGAIATVLPGCLNWSWGGTIGWGWAHTSLAKLGLPGTLGRGLGASQLFTYSGKGIVNEGQRISHSDDPTTVAGPVLIGDIVWRRTPVAAGYAGWMCTASGTNGTYTEGRTATTTGTTTVTLSAATHYNTGIKVGDTLVIGGVTSRVLDMNADLDVLTMSATQGTGSAQAITFAAPTFKQFGLLEA